MLSGFLLNNAIDIKNDFKKEKVPIKSRDFFYLIEFLQRRYAMRKYKRAERGRRTEAVQVVQRVSEYEAMRRLLVGSEFFRSAGENIPVTALDDLVGVSLLGEEQLAVHGEFLFLGILRHDARRWASSWRLPKVPEIWMSTFASGRSMAKLPTFETMRFLRLPSRKAP